MTQLNYNFIIRQNREQKWANKVKK